MELSKNEEVQKFLEEMLLIDSTRFDMIQKMREIVFLYRPEVQEKIKYGGIMFSLELEFGGIFVSKKHISFEFSNGYMMTDTNKVLEGSGKFRRHLKIKSPTDIEDKKLEFFVNQVV